MVSPVTITNTFNGDISAANYVNAAALDTQLTNLASTINSEIAERQRTVRDGSGLASQVVRFPSLHPEVTALLTSGGLVPKQAVAAVAISNVGSLSGLQVIDSYTLLANDRVLLVGQSNPINNGLWVAAAGAWTRPSDSANNAVLSIYTFVTVIYGTIQAGSAWYLTAAATVSVAAQSWVIYSSGGTLPIVRGGTGASTAAQALTNLGVSTFGQSLIDDIDAAAGRATLGLGSLAVLSSITQANLAADVQYRVDTIAALKALTITYTSVLVLGYYAAGDGGGGIFRWNGSDTTADNLGTIIIPASAPGTGRWNRVYDAGWLSVRWFGAKGDGVADDITAINATITRAASETWGTGGEYTGNVVYFPGGRYKISSSVVIGANTGVCLLGDGKTKSNLLPSSSSLTIISMTGSNNSRSYIKGMRLTGGSAANGIAINITGSGNQIDIIDNWIDTIKQGVVGNPTSDSYFSGNTMEYVSECFVLTSSNEITITNNTLIDCGPIALGAGNFQPLISLTSCLRIGLFNNRLISTSGMSSQPYGIIRLTSCTYITISGTLGNDEWSYVGGAFIDITTCDRVTVSNNHFGKSYGATVKDTNSANVIISNNTFPGSTQAGVKTMDLTGTIGFVVSGNIFKGGLGSYDFQCVNGVGTAKGIFKLNFLTLGYNIDTLSVILLSDNQGGATRAYLTAAPTAGAWLRGDIVYHQQPSSAGNLAWVCTASGSPGTWKSWGTIS
jgi:hypothetical protein